MRSGSHCVSGVYRLQKSVRFFFFLERKRMAEVFICDFPHITLEEKVVLVTHLASVSI